MHGSAPSRAPDAIRTFFACGALLAAAGVACGAFESHGLEDFLRDRGLAEETIRKRLDQAGTAVRYHLIHSVAVVAIAAASPWLHPRLLLASLTAMLGGILLFSGSLYVLVLANLPILGAITPFGGVSLILAWLLAGWGAFQSPHMNSSPPSSDAAKQRLPDTEVSL